MDWGSFLAEALGAVLPAVWSAAQAALVVVLSVASLVMVYRYVYEFINHDKGWFR